MQHGGRGEQVNIAGNRDGMLDVGHRELRVAARPAGPAGVRGHRPAKPFPAHRRANRHDLAAHPVTRHVRRLDGKVPRARARADHRVNEQHVTGRGGDQHLPRPRHWIWPVGDLEHVRRAEAAHLDGAHG